MNWQELFLVQLERLHDRNFWIGSGATIASFALQAFGRKVGTWLLTFCRGKPQAEVRARFLNKARQRAWQYLVAAVCGSRWARFWYGLWRREERTQIDDLYQWAEQFRETLTPKLVEAIRRHTAHGDLHTAKIAPLETVCRYRTKAIFETGEINLINDLVRPLRTTSDSDLALLLTTHARMLAEAIHQLYQGYVNDHDVLRRDELTRAGNTDKETICEELERQAERSRVNTEAMFHDLRSTVCQLATTVEPLTGLANAVSTQLPNLDSKMRNLPELLAQQQTTAASLQTTNRRLAACLIISILGVTGVVGTVLMLALRELR